MRCPNCKNDNPNGFRFCLQCGEDLGEPTIVQRPETVTRVQVPLESDAPFPATRRGNFWIYSLLAASLAALLIIALLGLGGFLYFSQPENANEAKQRSTPASERATVEPTRQPTREPTRAPTLEPTQPPPQQPARDVPIVEPERQRPTPTLILNQQFQISPRSYFAQNFTVDGPARLSGSFNSSSPVEVFVMRRDGTMWFQSGRINSGPIEAQLSAGNYTLLFNNRFSWLTGKNVKAVAYLQY
jgi:hypothetical protein